MEGINLTFHPSGDNGILITFGKEISVAVNNKIRSFIALIDSNRKDFYEIIELVPAYTTLLVIYNPAIEQYKNLLEKLINLEDVSKDIPMPSIEVIHIPVLYGGSYGPDLEYVAAYNKLTKDEVIEIHTGEKYLIYMMGFTPGFPYLGGMSEKIATPRLEVPREKITAGSVGIAGSQTGIYPIDSPGGWQIIGITPLKLFNPNNEEATLLKAGQYIKFYSINKEEFCRILKGVQDNTYVTQKTTLKGVEIDD